VSLFERLADWSGKSTIAIAFTIGLLVPTVAGGVGGLAYLKHRHGIAFAAGELAGEAKATWAGEQKLRAALAKVAADARAVQEEFDRRENEAKRLAHEAGRAESKTQIAEVRENNERLAKYAKALALREKSLRDSCQLSDPDTRWLSPDHEQSAAPAPAPPRRPDRARPGSTAKVQVGRERQAEVTRNR